MKGSTLAWLAIIALGATSGCCCIERLFCYGLCDGGPWGPSYGHEGPYGGGVYACGRCSDCREVGSQQTGGPGAMAEEELYESVPAPAPTGQRPIDGQPWILQNGRSVDEEEIAGSDRNDVAKLFDSDQRAPVDADPDDRDEE